MKTNAIKRKKEIDPHKTTLFGISGNVHMK